MKLELKHLAPYLPYGLKYEIVGQPKKYPIQEMQSSSILRLIEYKDTYKPILRPLSDLTKQHEINGKVIMPISSLFKKPDCEKFRLKDFEVDFLLRWQYQKLLEWNFDVFDLIPNDLAIDINTLEK